MIRLGTRLGRPAVLPASHGSSRQADMFPSKQHHEDRLICPIFAYSRKTGYEVFRRDLIKVLEIYSWNI